MLGIGNVVTAGSKVASVVRNGLAAWFKADKTQAPLGEEQVLNGTFETGPELVVNGSFDGVADGTDAVNVDGSATGWFPYGQSGFGFENDTAKIVNEQLVITNTRQTSTTNEIPGTTPLFNDPTDVDNVIYEIEDDSGVARATKSYEALSATSGALKITFTGTNGNALQIGGSTIATGRWYNVKFRAKGNANNRFGGLGDSDDIGLIDEIVSNPILTTSFQDYEFNVYFASGTFFRLYLDGAVQANEHFIIDNIEIKHTTIGANRGVSYRLYNYPAETQWLVKFNLISGGTSGSSNVYFTSGTNAQGTLSISGNGPYEFRRPNNGGANNTIIFFRSPNNRAGTAIYDDVSIKELNPGQHWSTHNENDHSTITFTENNKVEFRYDDTASGSALGISQEILKVGSKYRATLTIEDLEAHGSTVTLQDGSTDTLNNELKIFTGSNEAIGDLRAGTHTIDFTATDGTFYIYRDSGSKPCRVSLSNVSVKEITNSVKDSSNNSNDLTLFSGKALDFDDGDFFTADAMPLDCYGDYTFAFWAKFDELNRHQNIIAHATDEFGYSGSDGVVDPGACRIGIGLNSSNRLVINDYRYYATPDAEQYSSTITASTVVADRWYRVVGTSLNGYKTIYIDGEFSSNTQLGGKNQSIGSGIYRAGAKQLGIGMNNLETQQNRIHFNGKLSDVQVYDKAWTWEDVKYDYENPDKDVFDTPYREQKLGSEKSPTINNTNWETTNDKFPAGYNPISDNGVITWDGNQIGFAGVAPKSAYYDRTVAGKRYLVSFDYTRSAGTIQFKAVGDPTSNSGIDANTSGSNTASGIIVANGTGWYFTGSSSFVGTVSNVSIKEVLQSPSEILATDAKALFRMNEGAGTRIYNAAPVLGPELVTNNSFTEDLSGWTISGNDSTHTVTYSNRSARYQSDTVTPQLNFDQTIDKVVVGRTYQLTVDVTHTTGTLKIASIDANQTTFNNGVNTFNIVANSKTIRILRSSTNVDALINSVSLKEITQSSSYANGNAPNETARLQGQLTSGSNQFVYFPHASPNGNVDDSIIAVGDTVSIITAGGAAIPSGVTVAGVATSIGNSNGYDYDGDGNADNEFKITLSANATASSSSGNSNSGNGSTILSFRKTTPDENDVKWVYRQPYIPQLAMSSYSKKMIFGGNTSADYVDLDSQVTLAADRAASISFWFTYGTTNTTTDKYILGKVTGATDYLIINPQSGSAGNEVDKIQILMNNVVAAFNIETDLIKGKLYHCVVTIPAYSSGSEAMTCYINGVPQGDTENRANQAWKFRRIGGSTGTANNFHGLLDEISYFGKELSRAEVNEIYNSGTALNVRDHSCYTTELLQKGDWVSQGAIGDTTTPWFKNNNASAHFDCVIGDFKGRTNVMKYNTVLQQDGTVADTNTKKLTQKLPVLTAGEKYICEVDVWVEFGDFRCDSQNSYIETNFVQSGATGQWVTLTSNVLTALQDNDNDVAEFWIRPASDDLHSEFYVDKVSFKRYDLKGYWRNNGYENWFDLSPYGNDGTVNSTYPELVTNGDFSSALDSNDWTGVSDGVPTINGSNQLVVTINSDTYGSAVQEITGLEVGAEYDLTGTIISTTHSASINIQRTATTGVVQNFSASPTSNHLGSVISRRIIAPQETLYVTAVTAHDTAVNGNSVFDNISFKKVKPIQKFLQEVPLFKKDSLGLPMNRVRQQGLNFDGNAYAEAVDHDSLGTIAGGFSCAYWYRHTEDVAAAAHVDYPYFWTVTKGSGLSANADIAFGGSVYNNKIYSDLNTSAGRFSLNYTISPGSTNSPVWYYVTATYTPGEKFRQYINGVETNVSSTVTGTFNNTAESHPLRVGTRGNNEDSFARSVIDEVKWYNRPLSASEVKRNYNASKGRHQSTSNWSDDFSNDFI